MAKTGTSSIQKTLWSLQHQSSLPDGYQYPSEFGTWNASFNLIHSFENKESKHLQRLQKFFQGSASTRILSAEVLSNPAKRGVVVRKGLSDFLRSYDYSAVIYLYIRPPLSFMTSLFIQQLKMGIRRPEGKLFSWPNYRARITGLQEFARTCSFSQPNRLELVPFLSSRLISNDVTLDFLARIGISVQPEAVVRINESLSLEAVSLLYLENQELVRKSTPTYQQQRLKGYTLLQSVLKTIGSRKIRLRQSEFEAYLDRNDLDYAEQVLGCALSDTVDEQPSISLKQLAEIGEQSVPLLDEELVKRGVDTLNRLQAMSVAEKIHRLLVHNNIPST